MKNQDVEIVFIWFGVLIWGSYIGVNHGDCLFQNSFYKFLTFLKKTSTMQHFTEYHYHALAEGPYHYLQILYKMHEWVYRAADPELGSFVIQLSFYS